MFLLNSMPYLNLESRTRSTHASRHLRFDRWGALGLYDWSNFFQSKSINYCRPPANDHWRRTSTSCAAAPRRSSGASSAAPTAATARYCCAPTSSRSWRATGTAMKCWPWLTTSRTLRRAVPTTGCPSPSRPSSPSETRSMTAAASIRVNWSPPSKLHNQNRVGTLSWLAPVTSMKTSLQEPRKQNAGVKRTRCHLDEKLFTKDDLLTKKQWKPRLPLHLSFTTYTLSEIEKLQ